MITAGDRMVQLAGYGGAAGALLVSLAAGSTAGERMVARSTLGSETAAVHHMYDPPGGAGGRARQAGFMSNMGAFMTRV